MIQRLGFIGTGNMGGAILHGIIDAGYIRPSQVVIYDANQKKMDELTGEYPGMLAARDSIEVVEKSDMILLAIKPIYLGGVLEDLKDVLHGKALISIAAGWTVSMLKTYLNGSGATWLRVMPNTPAMVGEGMTAICDDTNFCKDDFNYARGIFDSVGKTVVLPERLFDGVIAISGSSPAYIFMMIEAMADAGVREGIPRTTAYEMAAQSVLGSALMVLQTGTHPASLKDAVCSPGGTTIDAVAALEEEGFRNAIMKAMHICAEKSRTMSK